MTSRREEPSEIALNPFKIILQPFRLQYWPLVESVKNLTLIGIYVYIEFPLLRLYAMFFVIFLLVILLLCVKPYHNPVLNTFDTSLNMLLLFFSAIWIFDSINIYNSAMPGSKRENLHNSFSILKIVLMVIPLLLLLMFERIHRNRNRK